MHQIVVDTWSVVAYAPSDLTPADADMLRTHVDRELAAAVERLVQLLAPELTVRIER